MMYRWTGALAWMVSLGAAMTASQAEASLIFHAGFNEGSGAPVATFDGNSISGAFLNGAAGTDPAPTYNSATNPFASGGYSASFAGIDTSVASWAPQQAPFNNYDLTRGTVAAWINMDTFATTGGNRIFSTRAPNTTGGAGSTSVIEFYVHGAGRLEVLVGGATMQGPAGTFTADNLGKWRFVAVTWDANLDVVEFFLGDESGLVNSVGINNSGSFNAPNANQFVQIGGYRGGVFDGLIDEVYVFDTALSVGDLRQLAQGVIPEPASVVLLGAGTLLMLRRRTA